MAEDRSGDGLFGEDCAPGASEGGAKEPKRGFCPGGGQRVAFRPPPEPRDYSGDLVANQVWQKHPFLPYYLPLNIRSVLAVGTSTIYRAVPSQHV
jgi:hypothetical protein